MENPTQPKPQYETPTITVMDEAKMLATFQVQAASSIWWIS